MRVDINEIVKRCRSPGAPSAKIAAAKLTFYTLKTRGRNAAADYGQHCGFNSGRVSRRFIQFDRNKKL